MSKIQALFKKRNEQGKKVNIAYLTPEYPFDGITVPLIKMLAENHVHIVEIGIPFSDPLADGPTIQKSSFEALQKGVNIPKIFSYISMIREDLSIPIVLMTYLNPVLNYGIEEFVKECINIGVDGLIIPDLPVDEVDPLFEKTKKSNLDLILLAAPTSPDNRLENIASHSSGFIYCVSVTGVTGVRNSEYITNDTVAFLKRIKKLTSLPVAVGFGLSEASQLKQIAPYTDGFIVGSALIKSMENKANLNEALQSACQFVQGIFADQV